MKLSISNIAWDADNDELVHDYLSKKGFEGIEIAPTRLTDYKPYSTAGVIDSINFTKKIRKRWNLTISSMQSILYGVSENIFSTRQEREVVLNYMCSAIDYANNVECSNLVFGCPRNRIINGCDRYLDIAQEFFYDCSDYAKNKGVIIALEANPKIYGTDFLNTTKEAIDFVKLIGHESLRLNLDVGTIIANNESIDDLKKEMHLVNHIHISEPYLNSIEPRGVHKQLFDILIDVNYQSYVSIEMKNSGLKDTFNAIDYASKIFFPDV